MSNFIYCYTTPEIEAHNGWCKIGMTKNASEDRIKQQTHTADVSVVLEWEVDTSYGNNLFVSDNEFRKYLVEEKGCEVQKEKKTEWIKISPDDARTFLEKLMCAYRNRKTIDESTKICVYQTNDYGKFHVLEGNRDVTQKRVNIIKESIGKVGYVINPIIVNENMEVIDGQGRLEACRQLNLPVYYIVVDGIGGEECRAMNEKNTSWTASDHIAYWCKMGNADFIRLHDVAVDFGYNESFVNNIAYNQKSDGAAFQNNVRRGSIKFTEEDADRCREICAYVRYFDKFIKEIGGSQTNARNCIVWLIQNTDIDRERLKKTFESRWAEFLPFTSKNERNIEMISNLYNKGLSPNKQNRFEYDYANFVRGKNK